MGRDNGEVERKIEMDRRRGLERKQRRRKNDVTAEKMTEEETEVTSQYENQERDEVTVFGGLLLNLPETDGR